MTVLGALARTEPRNLVTPWGDEGWSGNMTGSTWAGADVTVKNALQLLTVYGCARFICDGVSTMPVDTFRRDSDGNTVPLPNPAIIDEPAEGLGFVEWASQFLLSLLLAGNFYGLRVFEAGQLRQVIPIDPTVVTPFRKGGRRWYRVNGQEFTSLQIMHVPGIMWPGADAGLSPVEYARQTVGVGMASQEYAARFFADDSTPPGVIEVPGELTPDNAREMARSWSKAHSGKSKRKLPGVLQGGAQWKQTAVTNEQAQFLETRQFTSAEIAAQMFLIDPPEMGIGVAGQSLTYSNLEQRNARKVQVTFLPWIVRLDRALSSMLPRPRYVKLNTNALLRGDTTQRYQAYRTAIAAGFMVPDEARQFEDWGPMPDSPTPGPQEEP